MNHTTRGECVKGSQIFSYPDVSKWNPGLSEDSWHRLLEYLRKQGWITTAKCQRGVIVTDTFWPHDQNSASYKAGSGAPKTAAAPIKTRPANSMPNNPPAAPHVRAPLAAQAQVVALTQEDRLKKVKMCVWQFGSLPPLQDPAAENNTEKERFDRLQNKLHATYDKADATIVTEALHVWLAIPGNERKRKCE